MSDHIGSLRLPSEMSFDNFLQLVSFIARELNRGPHDEDLRGDVLAYLEEHGVEVFTDNRPWSQMTEIVVEKEAIGLPPGEYRAFTRAIINLNTINRTRRMRTIN